MSPNSKEKPCITWEMTKTSWSFLQIKGRAVVVMNTKDYNSKALELLSDTNTYTKENKHPTNKYAKKLSDILRKLKDDHTINMPTYRRLLPTAFTPPKFDGLLKIHKVSAPLCPAHPHTTLLIL